MHGPMNIKNIMKNFFSIYKHSPRLTYFEAKTHSWFPNLQTHSCVRRTCIGFTVTVPDGIESPHNYNSNWREILL